MKSETIYNNSRIIIPPLAQGEQLAPDEISFQDEVRVLREGEYDMSIDEM